MQIVKNAEIKTNTCRCFVIGRSSVVTFNELSNTEGRLSSGAEPSWDDGWTSLKGMLGGNDAIPMVARSDMSGKVTPQFQD